MTEPLKIAVVGGGPAGLLFAKLVAREHPNYRIDVFEQIPRARPMVSASCWPTSRLIF